MEAHDACWPPISAEVAHAHSQFSTPGRRIAHCRNKKNNDQAGLLFSRRRFQLARQQFRRSRVEPCSQLVSPCRPMPAFAAVAPQQGRRPDMEDRDFDLPQGAPPRRKQSGNFRGKTKACVQLLRNTIALQTCSSMPFATAQQTTVTRHVADPRDLFTLPHSHHRMSEASALSSRAAATKRQQRVLHECPSKAR